MLLLSCTLRHVRYIIMTQQSIKHSDRKYLCIQSKADFLIDTNTQTHHMNKSRHMFTCIYKLHQKNMHTHILQEYQLKPCDGNGTRELNIGVFVACLEMWQIHGCTQCRLCDGLPSLAPMFSATDSETHAHHSNRYSLHLCLHPIKQQWFILAIVGTSSQRPSHRTIYLPCALLRHSTWSTWGKVGGM